MSELLVGPLPSAARAYAVGEALLALPLDEGESNSNKPPEYPNGGAHPDPEEALIPIPNLAIPLDEGDTANPRFPTGGAHPDVEQALASPEEIAI